MGDNQKKRSNVLRFPNGKKFVRNEPRQREWESAISLVQKTVSGTDVSIDILGTGESNQAGYIMIYGSNITCVNSMLFNALFELSDGMAISCRNEIAYITFEFMNLLVPEE